MKLSTIQQTLAALDLRPAKSLGQNFLHDQNLARAIVDELDPQPGDTVVEIGPGLGALTTALAPRCRRLILLEKDRRLAGFLREHFGAETHVEVIETDALLWDTRLLFPFQPAKVIGNLPYYVSSQLLLQFTSDLAPVERAIFTLQKELAQRLAAAPGTKDYGALTLLVQRKWHVRLVRNLPPSVFLPQPKVESAVIRLEARAPGNLPFCHAEKFTSLVKQGFSQRRKQLRKLLELDRDHWRTVAGALGLSEEARAEELSLAHWIALTNLLAPIPTERAQNLSGEIFDVVDADDHVIDQQPRGVVHARGLRHRAVHIFIRNRAGEILLQKRSRWKDVHPGRWDSSAAGHVEAGHTYAETAPRELQEELAISSPLTALGRRPPSIATGQEWVTLFVGEHEGPFHPPPAEIELVAFFPPALIATWLAARPDDFAGGFRECFRLWRQTN